MSDEASVARDLAAVNRVTAVPKILQMVAHLTGMRCTVVARVTDKTWTACAVLDNIEFGLKPGSELVLGTTICDEVRQHHKAVVFGSASADPVWSVHKKPKMYGIESYMSIPIYRVDKSFFGTLCAIDPLPAKLDDPGLLGTMELFAQLIGAQLDVEDRLQRSDSELLDAHSEARLREQFIAVLGHDLRNPLQAIRSGAEVLQKSAVDERSRSIVELVLRSCRRITELIENTLDFARGRLGGGIPVRIENSTTVMNELQHVVAEVESIHTSRVFDVQYLLEHPVVCDAQRVGQLLGNLLANAIAYGDVDRPIQVVIASDAGHFELSVTNAGRPIPAEKLPQLFLPFTRLAGDLPQPGLGLGLYISSEIAKAHGGTLVVASTDVAGTRFTFRMPNIAESQTKQIH